MEDAGDIRTAVVYSRYLISDFHCDSRRKCLVYIHIIVLRSYRSYANFVLLSSLFTLGWTVRTCLTRTPLGSMGRSKMNLLIIPSLAINLGMHFGIL